MKFPSYLKKSIYSGFTFFLTILLLSIGYGALGGGLSLSDKVGTWSGLTASSWNRIIDGVLDLDKRTGAINSSGADLQVSGYNVEWFVGEGYQNTSISTDLPTWIDLPWTSVSFNIASSKTINLRGFWSITSAAWTARTYTHCGFRFVLDGIPYGDATWGDQIIGCNSNGSATPSGYWCPWNIERNISVTPGAHAVKVQMIWWGLGYATCSSIAAPYSAARLFVNAR